MKLFVKILFITLYVALFAGAVVLMAFAQNRHTQKKYTGLDVYIRYADNDKLVDASDVKMMITGKYGKVENLYIGELGQVEVLKLLKTNPYLKDISIKTSVEGLYQVSASQVNPKVRLIDNTGRQCLVDENEHAFPVSGRYVIDLPLVTGELYIPLNATGDLNEIVKKNPELKVAASTLGAIQIATDISRDSVMSALVEQIDVNASGNVNLYTKLTGLNIVFGDSADSKEKLDNLRAFLETAIRTNTLSKYYKINLQYKNQVVCSK